jgi:hypothetical protein
VRGANQIQHAGWGKEASMDGETLFIDLRERVVAAVVEGGLSRRQAAVNGSASRSAR